MPKNNSIKGILISCPKGYIINQDAIEGADIKHKTTKRQNNN
jgi:hypothetical protein